MLLEWPCDYLAQSIDLDGRKRMAPSHQDMIGEMMLGGAQICTVGEELTHIHWPERGGRRRGKLNGMDKAIRSNLFTDKIPPLAGCPHAIGTTKQCRSVPDSNRTFINFVKSSCHLRC